MANDIPLKAWTLAPEIASLAGDLGAVDGFTGTWLNYEPDLHLIVAGTDPAALHRVAASSKLVGVLPIDVYRTDVPLTTLLEAQQAMLELSSSRSLHVGVAVREDLGRVVVEVPADPTLRPATASVEELKREVPNEFKALLDVVEVRGQGDVAVTNLNGGGVLTSGCTSGFTVRGTGAGSTYRGLITAGHCDDSASQQGVSLGLASGDSCVPGESKDRQFHSIPAPHTASNRVSMSVSPYSRTITAEISTFYTGMPLEKQGNNTGYQTGTVQTVWYSSNVCGGLSSLVRSTNYTQPGDSGGPVFTGGSAAGITSALSVNNWLVFSRILYVTSWTGVKVCLKANCA
ncbi:MAG: hypothetical protein ACSLE8_23630 [Rhodococcus sp. (in: high G+C Gram-positive bacteria)]